MADGPSSTAGNGDSHESSIWRGLKGLIFGSGHDDSLRDQLEEAIDRHEDDPAPDAAGDLSPLERQMVRNLLHFSERDAGDVGVPRADIVAIEVKRPFAELVQLFIRTGHGRIPVYRDKLDTIIGMIHIRDAFAILASDDPHPTDLSSLIREPLFVPMSRGALDLLADMRTRRVHLAIVLDEYFGTEGIVTIEDLIEEIVGDIEDEHDPAPQALLVPLDGGAWDADARVELEDVGETIDERLGETDSDIDTLGGLTALLAGRVPVVGDCLDHPSGWKIEVTDADERRVHRLRLHPPKPEPEGD